MTPKEQRDNLVQFIAEGLGRAEALVQAGYELSSAQARMALMYLDGPEGREAVEKARMIMERDRVLTKDRTSDDVVDDLRALYQMSLKSGDLKTALRALELEGKHRGTFTEKIEVTGKFDLVNTILAARKRTSLKNRMADAEEAEVVTKELDYDFG